MNYLFIDSNIYLDFYTHPDLFRSLESLDSLQKHIIVTQQIADEVQRNSVSKTTEHLNNILKSFDWKKPSLPFKDAKKETLDEINAIFSEYDKLKNKIKNEIIEHIDSISTNQDTISQYLNRIFKNALTPTKEELSEAHNRKQFGNPPGKKGDPIGDQLSWIQMRNYIKQKDSIIIVSRDGDFYTKISSQLVLNSFLRNELLAKSVRNIFVYDTIAEALKELKTLNEIDKIPFEIVYFPTDEESKSMILEEKQISREEQVKNCSHVMTQRVNGVYLEYCCIKCGVIVHREFWDD